MPARPARRAAALAALAAALGLPGCGEPDAPAPDLAPAADAAPAPEPAPGVKGKAKKAPRGEIRWDKDDLLPDQP